MQKDKEVSDTLNGLKKVWIMNVYPQIDCGKYPAKYIINDTVRITADIISDGIDEICAILKYKNHADLGWKGIEFLPYENDCWQAQFKVNKLGVYSYTVHAWTNDFKTWKKKFLKKLELNGDVEIEKRVGVKLLKKYCKEDTEHSIIELIEKFSSAKSQNQLLKLISSKHLNLWIERNYVPEFTTEYDITLSLVVEPFKAQFSTWYELFPRSVPNKKGHHGSLQDLIGYLPIIKEMGFDVLYLPPIHPIGKTNRKGKNNSAVSNEDEPGSPWAIGAEEGGHKSIHPELGTINDFRELVKEAKKLNIDVALDFAIQCSPDHPYIKSHPQWFQHRPDGSLQFAENPPKKYQDIYPINFSSKEWFSLWLECKSILKYWINEGVTLFRVDNPHTKPFIFWQWLINEIKTSHPEVLFLAEAFTRPKIMQQLAKCGFSQSYTYFTWRNTKEELTSYMQELNSQPMIDYFRPNFWANTPDILHDYLQKGGRPAFMVRLLLAATLSSNYGIYGPSFELCIGTPLNEGSEEYLDSEKYEIVTWQQSSENISALITIINQIRHQHHALQNNSSLRFYPTNNSHIICYSKHNSTYSDIILVVVNLDYQAKQSALITLDLTSLGVNLNYKMSDLLTNETYTWQPGHCYVELDPSLERVAHIFHVRDEL
jgi:starch synthase (maltosyl-transferring)